MLVHIVVLPWFALSGRYLTAEIWVQSPAMSCGICGGGSVTGTIFSPSTSVFPVNNIPPLLLAHSLVYPRRCVISAFLSVVK